MHMLIGIRTHTHPHIHTYIHMNKYTHARIHTYIHMNKYTYTHIQTCMHKLTSLTHNHTLTSQEELPRYYARFLLALVPNTAL